MKRTFGYLSALVGLGGMIYLAGSSQAQPPAGAPPAAPQTRPTVAVFNMAAVMRDFGQAKFQVYQLNAKRNGMSKELMAWRADYIKTQQDLQKAIDPAVKDKLGKDLVELARKVEDRDRDINKVLNEDASKIISTLYDQIKTVVDKTAEMNGYHVVFAYPDAVTPEEQKSPFLKELKLKPPAAQPFFVNPQVDITGVVIGTLNKWYEVKDAAGQPVDVDELPPLDGPATPGTTPGAATPGVGAVPGGAGAAVILPTQNCPPIAAGQMG